MSHTVNFLHAAEAPIRHRKHRRNRAIRVALLVGLGLAAVWLAVILFAAGKVVAAASDGRDDLFAARDAASDLDFESADELLASADEHFASAETGLALLRTAEVVPWVSSQIRAANALTTSGRTVIGALRTAVDLGGELVRLSGMTTDELRGISSGATANITFDDLSGETKRAILERLVGSAPDLSLIAARISIARAELATIDTDGLLGPVASALGPLDAKLADAQETLGTLAIAAELIPEFAGLGRERAHLVLFLNNAELRPGGGFIGTYGVLKMRDGDITALETADSYALDQRAEAAASIPAPAPLARYNGTPNWFFRDANWSPDFFAGIGDATRLFDAERAGSGLPAQSFDGAIGVTPTFLRALLGITGPVVVGSHTFTADNVPDELEYQVEVGYEGQGIPPAQRKEIVGDFLNALKKDLYALRLSDWVRVADAVREGFAQKQIVLASMDAKTETTLSDVGWGGRVAVPSGDAQMVVDANIASLKSDPSVARSTSYELFQNASGQYVGRTTVTYSHTGSFDWKTTRYRTYTRLYVPIGSELIRVTGSMVDDKLRDPSGSDGSVDVATDLGMTSFGAFISIEPGQTRSLSFEYKLSDAVVESIRSGTYALTVLKQIGAQDNGLTLTLGFGKNVALASVPEAREDWGDQTYHLVTKLDRDLQFTVGF